MGKTALAVRAGYQLAHLYSDGQLFVNLHGHTLGHEPADPADVLAALLTAGGVDPRFLPAGLDERAAMWRDRMADRRALLILDNAAGSAQVAPLLPGTGDCLVIITSRRFLGDLSVALELPLDVLPQADALAMFTELAPRAAGDLALVAELVALCGRLPLAISLLARLFSRHRSWTMAELVGQTRARLLTVTAENRTLAAAFEASYQDLDVGRQRFFRHLGLHPGPEIDVFAAAALTGLPPAEAAGQLGALYADRLLEEPVPHRYQLHDLIRRYARDLAAADDGIDRRHAIDRLLDYYQHTGLSADGQLARHTRPALGAVPGPAAAPDLAGRTSAQNWLTAERANLTACIDYATALGDHARVTGLIAAMAAHVRREGPWPKAIALHNTAAEAAARLGDRRGQASALVNLADLQFLTGENAKAVQTLAQARDLYRDLGDRLGEANALYGLGVASQLLPGGPSAAVNVLEQALSRYQEIGDRLGEANALSGLGIALRMAGDYSGAIGLL